MEANGEKLFINLNYVDFNTGFQGSLSHALAPAEYAEIVQVFLDHLRDKYAIKPNSLEIVLEPDNTTSWRGTQIGQGAAAAGSRSTSSGYGSGDHRSLQCQPRQRDRVFRRHGPSAEGALDHMKAVSYHRYGSTDYRALQTAAKARGRQNGNVSRSTGVSISCSKI